MPINVGLDIQRKYDNMIVFQLSKSVLCQLTENEIRTMEMQSGGFGLGLVIINGSQWIRET